MAYTTINKSTDYFNTVLYTGNGSTQSITGVGFQPDFCWFKRRDDAFGHRVVDGVRGIYNELSTNSTSVEGADTNGLTSFDSDGVSIGAGGSYNFSGGSFVLWNWLGANGTASNTDGSITSTVSANTTAGFSIVSYTGTGSVATVGHGLGVAPKFIIVKTRSLSSQAWPVDTRAASGIVYLNETSTKGSYADSSPFPSTAPTSTVFSIGTPGNTNGSGSTYIAYCFAEVKGYSKFGSYTGNGNADGTFVYTGFKPAFVMLKNTTDASDWNMKDSKRPGYNQVNDILYPNLSNAEEHGGDIDIVSNGFKVRTTAANTNNNGSEYIYMAFGQSLVGSNNVPCTAR